MTNVIFSGDWERFKRDMENAPNRIQGMLRYNSERIINGSARAFKNHFNGIMLKEGHASLAKARVAKVFRRAGNNLATGYRMQLYNVSVSVPDKAVAYDIAKPHYVSLKKMSRTRIRDWVKRTWSYSKAGWRASASYARKSYVYGGKNTFKGSIYVLPHIMKYGWSVTTSSVTAADNYFQQEVAKFAREGFKTEILTIYHIKIDVVG